MPLSFGFLNCKLGITTQRLSHRVTVRLKKNITKLRFIKYMQPPGWDL